ncbi:MAG: SIMPL domain-containing protein [Chitinophagaceae bacterium]|nr:SIMPL domain-containing protein [Chitinophagaceae bacterium]
MKHLILLFAAIITLNSVTAQQPSCNPFPKTITVTGTAEMEIVPDEIYVQVDLREYKKRGEKAELEKIKTEFLNSCKSIGLPDSAISIASYEGINSTNWWRKRRNDPDLLSTISYQIKFNSSNKMDDLIEKLDDDATSNFRIVKTWHSKMTEYRKQLKIAAVKAAKEKGIYLTEAIGEKLGQAITVTEPAEDFQYQTSSQFKTSNIVARKDAVGYYDFNGDGSDGVDFKKLRLRFQVSIIYALQ